jgi:hypothetical protein
MECWSTGVLGLTHYSNTPVLQYSKDFMTITVGERITSDLKRIKDH